MSRESELIEQDIDAYLAQHEHKELLRFVTCGSVDDGKSTLIGRLLHDSNDDLRRPARGASKTRAGRTDGEIDFSLFTDGLRPSASRASPSTSRTATSRPTKRKFIIADTPGHVQYTRNMATGASTADVASS